MVRVLTVLCTLAEALSSASTTSSPCVYLPGELSSKIPSINCHLLQKAILDSSTQSQVPPSLGFRSPVSKPQHDSFPGVHICL